MPVRIAWARFHWLEMHRAVDAIDLARGINLAFGGDDAESAERRRKVADEVYPR